MTSESAAEKAEAPATEATEAPPSGAQTTGLKKKNLIIIALILVGLWAAAISSGSLAFLIVAGVVTLLMAGIGVWVWRQLRRHSRLADIMQGAASSPEGRRQAFEALSADKDANQAAHVLARAQLLAGDDPVAALALLEPVQLKGFPAAMQDDLALLKSQLLLSVGRAKEARPLADWINLDNPQRAEMRPNMVAIVAETWARTGSAAEANEILASVNVAEASDDAAAHLLIARVFARFGAGKKGQARSALRSLAARDPNLIGRFLAPQSRVHPGLQRLAREEAQRHIPRTRGGHSPIPPARRGR